MHQPAKNTPNEDQKLLAEFVRSRSERAFSALVEKYAPMVFNAAFRKTGDRLTAEEVTQNVFTILARKAAKLKRGSVLAGWLYRTAMFECSHALRKASSHKRKMKALAEQQSIQSAPEPIAIGEELDVALAKLPQSDQNILLLRFYEEMSFREIGLRLGKGDDASQKQVSRALEKLGKLLSRRGVAVPMTALASALSAEFTQAAPAAMNAGIAKAAITGAPALTAGTLTLNSLELMTYGKITKCLVLAALVAAVPLAVQQSQLTAARATLRGAEHETSGERVLPRLPTLRDIARAERGSPRFEDVDAWLEHCITEDEAFASTFERRQELAKMSQAGQLALLDKLEQHPGGGEPKRLLISDVIASIEKHSRSEALAQSMRLNDPGSASRILVSWAKDEPEAALAWFLEQQAAGKLEERPGADPDESHESWMIWRLAETIAEENPQRAIEFAATQNGSRMRSALRGVALAHLKNGHGSNLSQMASDLSLPEAEVAETLAGAAARQVAQSGAQAADWLVVNSSPTFVGEGIATLMQTWSDSNPGGAKAWIAALGESSLRDHAYRGIAEGFLRKIKNGFRLEIKPQQAREAAQKIDDSGMRASTLELIEQRVAELPAEEANR